MLISPFSLFSFLFFSFYDADKTDLQLFRKIMGIPRTDNVKTAF